MALTARAGYTEIPGGRSLKIPVATGVVIYDQALVGIELGGGNDGFAVNWADPTGSTIRFLGLARVTTGDEESQQAADEFVTGNTAGTVELSVDISGVIIRNISVTGVTAGTNRGDLVYASDENTFTLTATGGGREIGYVSRFYSGTNVDVHLFPAAIGRVTPTQIS